MLIEIVTVSVVCVPRRENVGMGVFSDGQSTNKKCYRSPYQPGERGSGDSNIDTGHYPQSSAPGCSPKPSCDDFFN